MKNWDFHISNIEQCKNQTFNSDTPDSAFKEGCQIYGTLQVNRVSTKNVLKHLGYKEQVKTFDSILLFYEDFLTIITKSILYSFKF